MEIKKNISLIVGIAIPIVMILLVAGSIYIPSFFIHPKYNFLYMTGEAYYGSQPQYSVANGKLMKYEVQQEESKKTPGAPVPSESVYPPRVEPKLFVYDLVKSESREVSFEEAQAFHLDSNHQSPDGFEVIPGNRSDVFPFFFGGYSDYNLWYISGHGASKKVNVQTNGQYYYNNLRFLGWISGAN